MNHVLGRISCGVLVVFATAVWADEVEDLRAKAKAVQREAEQLAKKGQQEEAEKLSRAAKELMHSAEELAAKPQKSKQPNPKLPKGKSGESDELKRELKALAGKENALKETGDEEGLAKLKLLRVAIERKLAERQEDQNRTHKVKPGAKSGEKTGSKSGQHSPDHAAVFQEVSRRIKHLHVAADNLQAAGMHDLAEELAERAEHMQRELHQAQEDHENLRIKRGKEDDDDDDHERDSAIRQLRHEVQRLRAELEEVRQGLKKRERDDD